MGTDEKTDFDWLEEGAASLRFRHNDELSPSELELARQQRRLIHQRQAEKFLQTHGYTMSEYYSAKRLGMTPEEYVERKRDAKKARTMAKTAERKRKELKCFRRSACRDCSSKARSFAAEKWLYKKQHGIVGKFDNLDFVNAVRKDLSEKMGRRFSMGEFEDRLRADSPIKWFLRSLKTRGGRPRLSKEGKMREISNRGATAFGTAMTERGVRQMTAESDPEYEQARAQRLEMLRMRRTLPPEKQEELKRLERRQRLNSLSHSEKELIRAKAQARYWEKKYGEPVPENYILDNLDELLVECNIVLPPDIVLEALDEMDDLWGDYGRDMETLASEDNDEERECERCKRIFKYNPYRNGGGVYDARWGVLCPDCEYEVMG